MVEDKDSPPPQEEEPEIVAPRTTRRSTSVTHSNGATNGVLPALPSSSNAPITNGNGEITSWECSVCTYQNIEEEFKCAICETRKGTSTRKPRATSQTQVVQIQALAAEVAKQTNATMRKQRRRLLRQQQRLNGQALSNFTRPGRLKNVDRTKGTRINVTVNNVTVVITDYPKAAAVAPPPAAAVASSTSPSPEPTKVEAE